MPLADLSIQDTETRLIEAARELLTSVGAEKLSMRAVALAAGVTPGAIYRYFPSREALIERVVSQAADRLQAGVWQVLAKFPVGSYERIVALGDMYIGFARTHSADYGVLFGPAAGHKRGIEDPPFSTSVAALEQCVRDCIAAGVFAPGDPKLIALLLWSRLHGLISLNLAFDFTGYLPDFDPQAGVGPLFDATRGFVLDGLSTRPVPVKGPSR